MQILRSVEVAPWGSKKYKSNQKPGKRTSLPQKVNPNSTLSLPTKEDEWSEEDEDDANIPYDVAHRYAIFLCSLDVEI